MISEVWFNTSILFVDFRDAACSLCWIAVDGIVHANSGLEFSGVFLCKSCRRPHCQGQWGEQCEPPWLYNAEDRSHSFNILYVLEEMH